MGKRFDAGRKNRRLGFLAFLGVKPARERFAFELLSKVQIRSSRTVHENEFSKPKKKAKRKESFSSLNELPNVPCFRSSLVITEAE